MKPQMIPVLAILALSASCSWSINAGTTREIGLANPETLLEKEFHLVIWNLYKRRDTADFTTDWIRLKETGHPNLPAIYLFQEIMNTGALSRWADNEGLSGTFVTQLSLEPDESGVATLGTVTPRNARGLVTVAREPFTETPKTALITEFEFAHNRENLLIVNLHGINFVSDRAWENEMLHIKTMIKEHRGPVILAGDFNPWNRRRNAFLLKLTLDMGLISAVSNPEIDKSSAGPLDRIYYTPESLSAIASGVVAPTKTSDHKPLWCRFRLKEKQ